MRERRRGKLRGGGRTSSGVSFGPMRLPSCTNLNVPIVLYERSTHRARAAPARTLLGTVLLLCTPRV
jgi:hypothetical protein